MIMRKGAARYATEHHESKSKYSVGNGNPEKARRSALPSTTFTSYSTPTPRSKASLSNIQALFECCSTNHSRTLGPMPPNSFTVKRQPRNIDNTSQLRLPAFPSPPASGMVLMRLKSRKIALPSWAPCTASVVLMPFFSSQSHTHLSPFS